MALTEGLGCKHDVSLWQVPVQAKQGPRQQVRQGARVQKEHRAVRDPTLRGGGGQQIKVRGDPFVQDASTAGHRNQSNSQDTCLLTGRASEVYGILAMKVVLSRYTLALSLVMTF